MSVEQVRGYCPECERARRGERPAFNHVLHLLATVFLCGCWAPVWVMMALTYNEPYLCHECGEELELDTTRTVAQWVFLVSKPAVGQRGGSQEGAPGKDVNVKGYYNREGKWVAPHTRSSPDSGGSRRGGRR